MEFDMMNNGLVQSDESGKVVLIAPGKTDFFIDILSDNRPANAPFYYVEREGDFILRARLIPSLVECYDAGALFVYGGEEQWIKLAFELTDLGYSSVVAVKTDGLSDDSNGERVVESEHYLQIVRSGDNWCLHHSTDGKSWKMARYCRLPMDNKIKVGLVAQSPLGEGCKVIFEQVELIDNCYSDIRGAK